LSGIPNPGRFGNPSNLRSTMLKTPPSIRAPGGGHALKIRMRLAHLASESVLFVHNTEFVHKNIRPDTLLLLRSHSTTLQPLQSLIGTRPHLTQWTMLGKASDLTSLRCEMSWLKYIYRHPHRQGLQPQESYNIGHDIYSLGAFLLDSHKTKHALLVMQVGKYLVRQPHFFRDQECCQGL
jgi:hypothetical protein